MCVFMDSTCVTNGEDNAFWTTYPDSKYACPPNLARILFTNIRSVSAES